MKKQKLLSICIVLGLIFSFFSNGTVSVSFAQERDDSLSTSTAPNEYTLKKVQTGLQKSITGGADILLIQTAQPWGSDADMQVMDSLGYSYDMVDMSNIGNVSLSDYPVVLIVNDQVQEFYDQYASQITQFESYVSSGGILVYFAAGAGWAGGQLNAPLPGGATWVYGYDPNNHIEDYDHPIVTGLLSGENVDWGGALTDNDLVGSYCSHGYLTNLPEGFHTILSSNIWDQPTLVEYGLGNGKVIASTLTWEAYWAWNSGGNFAKKALDDVFLYAFSGNIVPAGAKLDLRIEDAPAWVDVNKSRGSYVDVVARVSGDSAYETSVTLDVPADKFGNPDKTFTRNYPGDFVYGQENQYTNPGSGQYEISSTLQSYAGQYYKEYVWRFKIPDNASPESNVELSAKVSIPDHIVPNSTKRAQLNIIDSARSLLVTNRKLLFEKFQSNPSQNDVSSLLEEIYIQAMLYNGEVFYVDLYNDAAKNWDQDVDYSNETSANAVATGIDGLIDGWYGRLTKHPSWWETIKPEFLLIVGGDEIIPFYRADDRPYGDDEYAHVHVDDADPVGRVPQEHYLLSDNIYADVGGGKSDWEEGKLELSLGRIIGHSAASMRQFIENALLETPALSQAVMASRSSSHNLNTVRDRLNSRNVFMYGEENPDLTENDAWTRDEWITALEQPYQILAYQGHGAYNGWYGTDAWTSFVTTSNQPAGYINENHPLFVVAACNFAIPTDLNGAAWNPQANDNINYKLISLGASGIYASTGINTTAGWINVAYGERLYNDYFKYLIDPGSWFGMVPPSNYSEYFGSAMLKAKQNYPSNGFLGYNGTDKKTLMEYVYYGLPWSFVETPDNEANQAALAQGAPNGYAVEKDIPQVTAPNSYSRDIAVTVSSYQFTAIDDFELLQIPGADTIYTLYKPVLPVINTMLILPPDAAITSIDLVGENFSSLGIHTIPAADPVTEYNLSTGFTETMDVTGVYPSSSRFGYDVVNFGDHVEVRVAITPVTFNTNTHEVMLFDLTELRINYTSSIPVATSPMKLDKPEYKVNEIINVSTKIENVSANTLSLSGELSIYDTAGNLVGTTSSGIFNVNGGDSYLLQIPWEAGLQPGNYQTVLTIAQDGLQLVSTSSAFVVLSGNLSSVSMPSAIYYGEYGEFSLSFDNYLTTATTVAAKIHVYNANGIEVTSLLERILMVDPGATGYTYWAWDPSGLPEGKYFMRVVATAEDETYASGLYEVEIYAIPRIQTFADIPMDHWAWKFVERLYANGITGGCSTDPLNYCPTANVTRAQMAVFLLKGMYGTAYTPPDAIGTIFADVPADHMFGKWIEQLSVEGITGGCGNGNYCPDSPVTREQMAVFLLRAEHGNTYTPPASTGTFADVPADYWAAPWIEQLAAEGITGGCGGGNYCPKTIVNRAQMAVFLVAAFNLP